MVPQFDHPVALCIVMMIFQEFLFAIPTNNVTQTIFHATLSNWNYAFICAKPASFLAKDAKVSPTRRLCKILAKMEESSSRQLKRADY